jgi:hypothetical protein
MQLNLHWGTFVKVIPSAPGSTSVQVCLEIAETALRRFGLVLFDPADEAGDFAVAGQTPDGEVIVQVVCVPLEGINTWIIVSAYSNSSRAAESLRNLVREFIVDKS